MSDKIKLNVTMKYKADSYKQANNLCIVEEVVPIPDSYFLEMTTYPCRDNPYITLHKDSMYADSEAMHCVLFIAEKQGDGFLVESEGYDYARYSQYISHASDIVAGQQIRTSTAYEKLKEEIAGNLSSLIAHSGAEPEYMVSYDSLFGTPAINKKLLQLAREVIAESPGFAGTALNEKEGMVEIDGRKFDTLRFISPVYVEIDDFVLSFAADPAESTKYARSINSVIQNEGNLCELFGLMDRCEDLSLSADIYSASPSVEVINGELVGVTTVKVMNPLDSEKLEKLKEYIGWQYSEDWGMQFFNKAIYSGEDRIHVDFGNIHDPQIMTEEEWNQSQGESLALQQ